MRPPWRITHIRVSDFVTYPSSISSLVEGGNNRLGVQGLCPAVWYNIFRVFYNLVISKVIINTLLCNLINKIVKNSSRCSVDVGTLM